ncbi:uncharacterized protein LOC125847024 [Solanum stenotomum]|uniref:uncharacterized protein LOC125847024 n=1 Tax=Solanum stenotomum TaxID=172797 RepID=UPI0020D1AA4F|nr:uncharacterized protein LOC125847024 [Solanum stenotomum]
MPIVDSCEVLFPSMEDHIIIGVDLHGEWVEKIIETTNSVVNDEEHPVTMDIPINEEASLHPISTQGPSSKDIKNIVQADLGCKISYWKCWKSSEIAKAMIRGTPEHGYAVLDGYRHMLMTINEGSKTSLKLDDKGRFKYFFASYGAWIRGFVHMRKVLAVDGTFLRGRYDGVLLSVVAQDTENHVFPVAFCVVDKECDTAYEYFFEKLLDIVPDTSELCIISDRHPSIEKTLSKFYSEAYHGCCTRHLGENARKNFHCGAFLGHYYHATKAYRRDVFHDHFEQIQIINAEVTDYLENVGFHKWSRAYFPGNRYDVLTSNIVESVNAMFNEAKEFPIIALFNDISKRWSKKFHERRMAYAKIEGTTKPVAGTTKLVVETIEPVVRTTEVVIGTIEPVVRTTEALTGTIEAVVETTKVVDNKNTKY